MIPWDDDDREMTRGERRGAWLLISLCWLTICACLGFAL